MSGHSKWHNIQKTKGAADAKRYCSSEQLIRETNGLTDDAAMAEPPQYLLIPKTQA